MVQSTQSRTNAPGVRKVLDRHSAQMRKQLCMKTVLNLCSCLCFTHTKKKRKAVYHLLFLTAV